MPVDPTDHVAPIIPTVRKVRDIMIKANHPVRNAFAGCSTGSSQGCYYSSKGHAVNAFDAELQTYDFCLDRDDLADLYGNEGRKVVEVHDEFHRCVGRAVFTWFRMCSGRYDFIGYLA